MPSLFDSAAQCLAEPDPARKVTLTHAAATAFRSGELGIPDDAPPPRPITAPGRPEAPRLVHPRDVPQRGMGTVEGRAAFLHAIAHIEFNAINLAWDAVYRFRGMPEGFYADWVGVADDEARHFAMLTARMAELGAAYGDHDAHNGLWEMAEKTAGDVTARMALVPRTLEARGLDATPAVRAKLAQVGDHEAAAILDIILRDEVGHVAIGNRWYHWLCTRDAKDPVALYAELAVRHKAPSPRGPFNREARRAAGFSDEEMAILEATK